VPDGATDIAPRIAGVQGCYWGEFTTGDRQMEAMLAPRLLGVACKAWEGDGRTDGPGLQALAGVYGPLFDRIGWQRNAQA
jgi:hexosaminidase